MGCTVDVDEEMIFLYNTRPISLTRLLSIHLPTVYVFILFISPFYYVSIHAMYRCPHDCSRILTCATEGSGPGEVTIAVMHVLHLCVATAEEFHDKRLMI